MAFRGCFQTPSFFLRIILSIVCVFFPLTIAKADSPRSLKKLESQIRQHRTEYERLHRLWLKNQKLEKKYQTKEYDLTFQV